MTKATKTAKATATKAKPGKAKPKLTPQQIKAQEREARKAKAEADRKQFEATVISTFAAHGYKNIRPRETVLTAKLWADKGMRVKDGERPLVVAAPWSPPGSGYVMYHASQMTKAQG